MQKPSKIFPRCQDELPRADSVENTDMYWAFGDNKIRNWQILEREHADFDFQFGSVKSFWPCIGRLFAVLCPNTASLTIWFRVSNFFIRIEEIQFPEPTKEASCLTLNGAWDKGVY